MARLTRWVLAHKRVVTIAWIALTIAGIAASGPASKALDQKFGVPKKEGWETSLAIAKKYGNGGDNNPLLPVVTLPSGASVSSPRVTADLPRMDARLHAALPGARIASYASTGDRTFLSKDGTTTFAVVWPRPDPD